MSPRILIVATRRDWVGIARLPRELQHSGFQVAVLCLPKAYLWYSGYVDWFYLLKRLRPSHRAWRSALVQVVEDWRPTLVIPGDDPTVLFLHQIVKPPRRRALGPVPAGVRHVLRA